MSSGHPELPHGVWDHFGARSAEDETQGAPKNLSFFLSSFPASVEAACQGAPEGVARALGLNHNDVVYRGQTNRRPGFRAAKEAILSLFKISSLALWPGLFDFPCDPWCLSHCRHHLSTTEPSVLKNPTKLSLRVG